MAELSQNNCPVVEMAEEAKAKGNAAFSAGNFQEAIRHFTEAISHSPSNHILYSNRSAAYASLSLFPQALTDAKKTVDLKPDWFKGYARLGFAYMGLNRIADAFISYEKGLKIDPNNQGLKSSCEDALARVQDPRNIEAFVKNIRLSVLELGEDEAEAVEKEKRERKAEAVKEKEAGDAAYLNKDFEAAILCYGRAIELDDEDILLLMHRAKVYLEMGMYEDCIQDCDKAVERGRELGPDFKMVARALTRKGDVQLFMKEYEKALETYVAGLELDPSNAELQDGVRRCVPHINKDSTPDELEKRQGVGAGPPGSGGEMGEEKEKRERKAEAVKEKEAGNAPLG